MARLATFGHSSLLVAASLLAVLGTAHSALALGDATEAALQDPPAFLAAPVRAELTAQWRALVQPIAAAALAEQLDGGEPWLSAEVAVEAASGRPYLAFSAEAEDGAREHGIAITVFHGAGAEGVERERGVWFEPMELAGHRVSLVDFPADRAASTTLAADLRRQALYWQKGEVFIEARAVTDPWPLATAAHRAAEAHRLYDFPDPLRTVQIAAADQSNVSEPTSPMVLLDQPRADGVIRLRAATLGASCGMPEGNLTWQLSRTCDGQKSCDILLEATALGVELASCRPDLAVTWRCGDFPESHAIALDPGNVLGRELHLACGEAPVTLRPVDQAEADVTADAEVAKAGADDGAPAAIDRGSPDFDRVANAGIPGFNNETHANLGLGECQALCVERSWCKSVDYERATGACYLQPVAEEDVGSLKRDYPNHPYDHYAYRPRLAQLSAVEEGSEATDELAARSLDDTRDAVGDAGEVVASDAAAASQAQVEPIATGDSGEAIDGTGGADATAEFARCPVPVAQRYPIWDVAAMPEVAENNTIQTARPLAPGTSAMLQIDQPGDVDWLRIPADARGELRLVAATVPAPLKLMAQLRDEDGNVVHRWRTTEAAGGPVDMRFDLARPGYYHAEIKAEDGAASVTEAFAIEARLTPVADGNEPNDSTAFATPLAFGRAIQAHILPAGDVDFYCLAIDRPGELAVRIDEVDAPLDLSFQIRDASGRVVHRWAEATAGAPIAATRDLSGSGVHYLELATASGNVRSAKPYRLTVEHRPVADPVEPNGQAHDATPLAMGETIQAQILPLGDYDWYRFEAARQGALEVAVAGMPEGLDIVFQVRRADGGVLYPWAGNPGRLGEDNVTTVDLAAAGSYFLELADSESNGRSSEPYSLTLQLEPTADPAEPNGQAHDATPLAMGETIQAQILPLGDYDWYRFEAAQQGALEVAVTGMPEGLDIVFQVRRADGGVLHPWAGNPGRLGEDNVTTVDLAAAGSYFLELADRDNNGRSSEPYSLTLQLEPTADVHEPNASGGWAAPLELGEIVDANILPKGDVDWYRLLLPEPGELEVTIDEMPANLRVAFQLRDAKGGIRQRTVAAPGLGQMNRATVPIETAGIYYLELFDQNHNDRAIEPYRLQARLLAADGRVIDETSPAPEPLGDSGAITDETAADQPRAAASVADETVADAAPSARSEAASTATLPAPSPAVTAALATPSADLPEETLTELAALWQAHATAFLSSFFAAEDELEHSVEPRPLGDQVYLHFITEGRNAGFAEAPERSIRVEIFHAGAAALEEAYGAWFKPISAGPLGTWSVTLEADRAVRTNLMTQGLGTEALVWQAGEHVFVVQAPADVESLGRTVATAAATQELIAFPGSLHASD